MAQPLPDIAQTDYNQSQAALFDQQTKPLRDSLDAPSGTPVPDPTLSPNQHTVRTGGTPSLRDRNLINPSSQFDYISDQELTPQEAASACGPVAALTFARYSGRNPTIGEALQLAKQVGWTPSIGMAGPQSEVSLLGKMGVHSQYNAGATPQDVIAEIQSGRPVLLDSPNHYYSADAFDPTTGKFHVGGSGLSLRNGAEWMSWNDIAAHGGGVRGSITVQSPSSLTPSSSFRNPLAAPAAVSSSPTAGVLPPGGRPAGPTPPTDFETYAKQTLAQIDQTVSGVGSSVTSAVAAAPTNFESFAKQTLAQIDASLSGSADASQNAPQTQPQAATGPIGTPGYNDMVGASSGPANTGLSSTYGQPAGIQAEQPAPATGAADNSANFPGMGGFAPNQTSPLPTVGGIGQTALDILNAPAQLEQSNLTATGESLSQLRQYLATGAVSPAQTPTFLQAFQGTDPALPFGERVRLSLAMMATPFAKAVDTGATAINQVDPTGGLAAGAFRLGANTITNPLMFAGEATPAMGIGTAIGGLAGYGVAKFQGQSPADTAQAVESGANLGMMGGPIAESLGRAAISAAPGVARRIAGEVAPLSPAETNLANVNLGLAGTGGGIPGEEVPPTTATPREPDARGGNILLRKYAPDVQQIIADAAAKAPDLMEAARRGVVSDATVQQLADAAGTTVPKIVARWKPGQAANAETITALRSALDGKAQEVIDAQQAIAQGGDTTANALRLQLAYREHQAVQQTVSGVTAEAGRGLRALRQNVTQAIQSNDTQKMSDILKKLGGRDWTDELASKLGQLDTTDPTQVHTFLRDMAKPKAADYVNEWLYNAILSNPATHVANTVSNTINALSGVAERATAAAIDVPLAALQGRPRGRFLGEAGADAYGLLQGIPEGVRAATYALLHGFTEEEAVKGEMPRMQAFRGPVGNIINAPSRALNAADAFMRPIMQRGALNSLIYRQAMSEGARGQALIDRVAELTANVPHDLMEKATYTAEYQLYRQPPKTLANSLVKLRGLNVAGIEPLRFVVPFVQVPVNATKYGLERSPLGLLNPDLWKNLAAKDPAAADNLARFAQGAFITAGIGALVGTGNLDITGAAPTSPAARDAFYRQGKLPFALKIGGNWYQYQRWEPMNHALTQVAAAVDAIKNAKHGVGAGDIAGQAALTIAQNVASQSFLSGINSLLNAASDPGRYGSQLINQLETAPLPFSAGMRAAANVVDPRQRAPQGALQNLESAIPRLSRNVPSRLNAFGQGESQPGTPVLPYKWQGASVSKVERELARLKIEPGLVGASINGVTLTPQERRRYQVLAGQPLQDRLTQLVNSASYDGLTDEQQTAQIQRAIDQTRKQAQDSMKNDLVGAKAR